MRFRRFTLPTTLLNFLCLICCTLSIRRLSNSLEIGLWVLRDDVQKEGRVGQAQAEHSAEFRTMGGCMNHVIHQLMLSNEFRWWATQLAWLVDLQTNKFHTEYYSCSLSVHNMFASNLLLARNLRSLYADTVIPSPSKREFQNRQLLLQLRNLKMQLRTLFFYSYETYHSYHMTIIVYQEGGILVADNRIWTVRNSLTFILLPQNPHDQPINVKVLAHSHSHPQTWMIMRTLSET